MARNFVPPQPALTRLRGLLAGRAIPETDTEAKLVIWAIHLTSLGAVVKVIVDANTHTRVVIRIPIVDSSKRTKP